jgi:hypothetical protein
LHFGRETDDVNLDFYDRVGNFVGWMEEVACPASAYRDRPAPKTLVGRATLPGGGGVSVSAVNATHTRVIVNTNMDTAWIEPGTCRAHTGRRRIELDQFYSFRSDTVIRIPAATLVRTPHIVLLDRAGAHGSVPLWCALLKPT